MKPGRPRKYKTKAALSKAIDSYFNSISCTEAAKYLDGKEIKNDEGKPVIVTHFVVPPTVSSLCLYLGIDRSTWQNYCDEGLHPEFSQATSLARARIEAYLEEQLLTREKALQGIIFNLQNNYGWRAKQEVELGEKTRRDMQGKSMSVEEKYAAIKEATQMLTQGGTHDEGDLPNDEDEDEDPDEH